MSAEGIRKSKATSSLTQEALKPRVREVEGINKIELSPAEVAASFDTFCTDFGGDAWNGGTKNQAREWALKGHTESLDRARRMQAQIRRDAKAELMAPQIAPAVCGGAVCVPAAIAGQPKAFRRMVPQPHPRGIRLWIDMGASGGYSADTLVNRGLACLALATTLARSRPVELNAILCSEHKDGGEGCTVIRLGVNPPDWSAASAILGNPAVFRLWGIAFEGWLITGSKQSGQWCRSPTIDDRWRRVLGGSAQDVYIDGALLKRDDLENPERWVVDQIERIRDQENGQ